MLLRDLSIKDVNVGLRVYYRRENKFGKIREVKLRHGELYVAITWDNGHIGELHEISRYDSEVFYDNYFVISYRKR